MHSSAHLGLLVAGMAQPKPSLVRYYESLESRLGYRFFLGDTRHFGYYKSNSYWPFPISAALRRMERQLHNSLSLRPGALVLDAGCGVAHVAAYLAREGLRIDGIDLIDHHIEKAGRNLRLEGLQSRLSIRKMDYQDLKTIESNRYQGVYSMETLVHASEPRRALTEFFRVLEPGGSIALYEYDHEPWSKMSTKEMRIINLIVQQASLPGFALYETDFLPKVLEEVGFEEICIHDLSPHIKPMLRLFFITAVVPYLFLRLFRLERHFVNVVAGVHGYMGLGRAWRYVVISARKPKQS